MLEVTDFSDAIQKGYSLGYNPTIAKIQTTKRGLRYCIIGTLYGVYYNTAGDLATFSKSKAYKIKKELMHIKTQNETLSNL